jgi:hypothetical protein
MVRHHEFHLSFPHLRERIESQVKAKYISSILSFYFLLKMFIGVRRLEYKHASTSPILIPIVTAHSRFHKDSIYETQGWVTVWEKQYRRA